MLTHLNVQKCFLKYCSSLDLNHWELIICCLILCCPPCHYSLATIKSHYFLNNDVTVSAQTLLQSCTIPQWQNVHNATFCECLLDINHPLVPLLINSVFKVLSRVSLRGLSTCINHHTLLQLSIVSLQILLGIVRHDVKMSKTSKHFFLS